MRLVNDSMRPTAKEGYTQWWAQLTKTLASITGNPLTEKLASITLNR